MAPRSGEADAREVRLRPTLVLLALAAAALLGAVTPGADASVKNCGAGAHGSEGYAYAGHQSTAVAHGVRATITPLIRPSVPAGHVAGWVGVGGPGQGAHGETVWLQVGIASLPNTPPMIYAEITRAGKDPLFVPVLEDVEVGESHRVAVLEMAGRPNVWRVWVDGKPVTKPLLLPGSTARWRPIATAESWNGGSRSCNGFSFRFDGVSVATRSGGGWRSFVPGFAFLDRGYAVKPLAGAPGRQRTLATDGVTPYAFEASSV
jgi:hypothetical protein